MLPIATAPQRRWPIARLLRATSRLSADGRERTYVVEGQLLYASVEGFSQASGAIVDRLAVHDKPGAPDRLVAP